MTLERPMRAPRPARGSTGSCRLWIAIPLDVAGLYLLLAGLHVIPQAWPAPDWAAWLLVAAAAVLFALARAVALIALRGLMRWRLASDSWSRMVTHRSHDHRFPS